MEKIKTNLFILLTIIVISIGSLINIGCDNDPPEPTIDYNSCVYFDGGGFCISPFEEGVPSYDLTITVTDASGSTFWTNNGTDDLQVVHHGLMGFSYWDDQNVETKIHSINCIDISIPSTGSYTVSVSLRSHDCLICCNCVEVGGVATITGETIETGYNTSIYVELNHDIIDGCPIEDCCY